MKRSSTKGLKKWCYYFFIKLKNKEDNYFSYLNMKRYIFIKVVFYLANFYILFYNIDEILYYFKIQKNIITFVIIKKYILKE